MEWLKRLYTKLSRLGHSWGFGIQSPTDYWLVRYVLCEHWPYYQYETLAEGLGRKARRRGELYFRLTNWRQPSLVVSWQGDGDTAMRYVQAACRKSEIRQCHSLAELQACAGRLEMMRLSLGSDARAALAWALERADEDTVLVVDDLTSDTPAWQALTADERVGVIFDLCNIGIVLFNKRRAKHNYKLSI